MTMPTKAGLWWRGPWGFRQAVEVELVDGVLMFGGRYDKKTLNVEDDGKWSDELTPSERYEFYDWCCRGYRHNGSCRDIDRD